MQRKSRDLDAADFVATIFAVLFDLCMFGPCSVFLFFFFDFSLFLI